MSLLHRHKGGTLHVEKKTVIVRFKGREHTVSWFSGASDESISRAIDIALSLPPETLTTITDHEDGSELAISDSIPDGLTLDVKVTVVSNGEPGAIEMKGAQGALHGPADNASRSGSPSDGHQLVNLFDGDAEIGNNAGVVSIFRGELLTLERIEAQLANDRTWLAWMRTSFDVISIALGLLSLSGAMDSVYLDGITFALGVGFVVCTLLAIVTAWLRYARVKVVLLWTASQVKDTFGIFDIKYFTTLLAVAFVLIIPIYIMGGVNVIQTT